MFKAVIIIITVNGFVYETQIGKFKTKLDCIRGSNNYVTVTASKIVYATIERRCEKIKPTVNGAL